MQTTLIEGWNLADVCVDEVYLASRARLKNRQPKGWSPRNGELGLGRKYHPDALLSEEEIAAIYAGRRYDDDGC